MGAAAVEGLSANGPGVRGLSGPVVGPGTPTDGVFGQGANGVHGRSLSATGSGVFGENTVGGPGVTGIGNSNDGVRAVSTTGNGLSAFSETSTAVFAKAKTQPGVSGLSDSNDGVRAVSNTGNGLSAFSSTGTGVYAKAPVNAGFFEGNVAITGNLQVNGDITLLPSGMDCAEHFDVSGDERVEPGTVMVFNALGAVEPSRAAYDQKVAGVISGAGDLRPGIILGKVNEGSRVPVALIGKVYCKVDARYSAIEVGDLLTTSTTAGHAMKVEDSARAFGAVLGKALAPMRQGAGLLPVLVMLR